MGYEIWATQENSNTPSCRGRRIYIHWIIHLYIWQFTFCIPTKRGPTKQSLPEDKNTKSQNYKIYEKVQNINYANYRWYKIYIIIFWKFSNFSKISKVFGHIWSILYNKSIFWISDSDSVYLTVYGNIG